MELALLVLESVLLIFTVILLLLSRKEGRSRDALLREVSRATKILTRHEYFLTLTDGLLEAKEEVVGSITGRLPKGEDEKRTKEVATHIKRLTASGVTVKYLMPKFHDRLYVGYLYFKAGAEIYYSGCPIVHDLRYTVIDDRTVLVGIPESTGEAEATRKGYKIPSEGLADIIKKHFDSCILDTVPYEEYVKELLKHTGTTTKILAREVQVPEDELKRITELKPKPAKTESSS